jgi:outer membrane biosynthesis protein TonB
MIQLYLKISLCALLLLAALPLHAQQKQKQLEQQSKSKPAAPKPKPAPAPAKEPEAYAYLLVTTDQDVNISVNFGKSYRVSPTDEGRRIPLENGGNLVKITPSDGGADGYTKEININSTANVIHKIELKAKREALAASKAEEAQKVEQARLAEQKRKQDEEAALKVEEDRKAEQKRKAEEDRKAEQRRKEEEARKIEELFNQINSSMVLVSGGNFTLGCTSEQSDCGSDEKPAHQVMLSNFYIGESEVTQALWRAVMDSDPPELNNKGCDQCPVERVSWDDIKDFLSWLNSRSGGTQYRLPT